MTVPTDVEISAGEAVEVKSVDSSGAADLAITLTNFTIKSTTAGVTNTVTGIPESTMDVNIAADGRILSLDGNQDMAGNAFLAFSGMGGGLFVTAVQPSHAVKPGDTWSKDYDQANPGGTGSIHITSNSKYLRDETLNGVSAAVVETTSTGSMDFTLGASGLAGFKGSIRGTLTSEVTTWIDPNSHRVLKTHASETNDGSMTFDVSSITRAGRAGPITMKATATTDLTPA
ncbi:MAG: hypothetical protein ACYDA0_05215 [Candidatus Dormibacteraceae bacterium]